MLIKIGALKYQNYIKNKFFALCRFIKIRPSQKRIFSLEKNFKKTIDRFNRWTVRKKSYSKYCRVFWLRQIRLYLACSIEQRYMIDEKNSPESLNIVTNRNLLELFLGSEVFKTIMIGYHNILPKEEEEEEEDLIKNLYKINLVLYKCKIFRDTGILEKKNPDLSNVFYMKIDKLKTMVNERTVVFGNNMPYSNKRLDYIANRLCINKDKAGYVDIYLRII